MNPQLMSILGSRSGHLQQQKPGVTAVVSPSQMMGQRQQKSNLGLQGMFNLQQQPTLRQVSNRFNSPSQQQNQQPFQQSTGVSTQLSRPPVATGFMLGDRVLPIEIRYVSNAVLAQKANSRLQRKIAETCSDPGCRDRGMCSHCNLTLRDAASQFNTIYNFYYAVLGMNFTLTLPVPAATTFTQWLVTNPDASITITTGVTPPVPGAGEALIQFTGGAGFGPDTRPGDLVMFNGISDAASTTSVSTKGHLLNSLWIVNSQPTSTTWGLTPLSTACYRVNDKLQFLYYATSALGNITNPSALASRVVTFTVVNSCVDQTIEWAETLITSYPFAVIARISRVTPPTNACSSCSRSWGDGSSCNPGCRQCSKHEVHLSLDHGISVASILATESKAKNVRHEIKSGNMASKAKILETIESGGSHLVPLNKKEMFKAVNRVVTHHFVSMVANGITGFHYDPKTRQLKTGRYSDQLSMSRKELKRLAEHESNRLLKEHDMQSRAFSTDGTGVLDPSLALPKTQLGQPQYRRKFEPVQVMSSSLAPTMSRPAAKSNMPANRGLISKAVLDNSALGGSTSSSIKKRRQKDAAPVTYADYVSDDDGGIVHPLSDDEEAEEETTTSKSSSSSSGIWDGGVFGSSTSPTPSPASLGQFTTTTTTPGNPNNKKSKRKQQRNLGAVADSSSPSSSSSSSSSTGGSFQTPM